MFVKTMQNTITTEMVLWTSYAIVILNNKIPKMHVVWYDQWLFAVSQHTTDALVSNSFCNLTDETRICTDFYPILTGVTSLGFSSRRVKWAWVEWCNESPVLNGLVKGVMCFNIHKKFHVLEKIAKFTAVSHHRLSVSKSIDFSVDHKETWSS